MRPLYTIQELANTLRLQPETVRNKLSRGEDLPRNVELGAGGSSPKTRWRPGCKLRKALARLPRLPTIRPPPVLSRWAGHGVLRLFPRLLADPDAERLGIPR